MKFTVQKANIMSAMEIAFPAIPSSSTQPIMYAFRIEVGEDGGIITANDLGTSIRSKFSVLPEESGTICIKAKDIMQAVKKISSSEVTFEKDGSAVIVTGGKARFEFPLENEETFVNPPSIDDKEAVKLTVDGESFSRMVSRIAFAVAKSNSNRVLTGINMAIKGGKMTLTALDLVQVAIRYTSVESHDVNVNIPQKAMVDLAKMVSDEDLDVAITKNHIVFAYGSTIMTVRLIDGKFFNIEQIMKNEFSTTISVNRADLIECLDRSLVVIKEDKQPIVVTIKDGYMNVSLKNTVSAFSEDVDCSIDGDDIKIGLSPIKLHEILRNIEDTEIKIGMISAVNPIFVNSEEHGYNYILLPVNI